VLYPLIASIVKQREFIGVMAVRELRGQHAGALLGLGWQVLNPLIKVGAYVVIVSIVFGQRTSEQGGIFDYSLYVLSGMIPWQWMTKVIEESSGLIRSRQELLKQVIYPIETLPVTSMIVGGVSAAVSLGLFLFISLVTGGANPSWLLLPLPVALLAVLLLGLAWLFSIVGVVIRDLRDVLSTVLGLLVYLSPVVLNRSIVGDDIWRLILYNPLSHVVICFRNVLYGQFDSLSWFLFGGMAAGALLIGSIVMSRTKSIINEHL
jgi:lipopolysaccharide transport system permease protein